MKYPYNQRRSPSNQDIYPASQSTRTTSACAFADAKNKAVAPLCIAWSFRGKRLHTRNRHLRNHRGFSVAFAKGFSVAFSNGCLFCDFWCEIFCPDPCWPPPHRAHEPPPHARSQTPRSMPWCRSASPGPCRHPPRRAQTPNIIQYSII